MLLHELYWNGSSKVIVSVGLNPTYSSASLRIISVYTIPESKYKIFLSWETTKNAHIILALKFSTARVSCVQNSAWEYLDQFGKCTEIFIIAPHCPPTVTAIDQDEPCSENISLAQGSIPTIITQLEFIYYAAAEVLKHSLSFSLRK